MTANLPESFDEPGLSPVRSLAAALAPLEATLERTRFGWRLELTPIRAGEALAALAAADDASTALTLLHDVVQEDWRGGAAAPPLDAVSRRLALEPHETVEDAIVLDDEQLPTLLLLLPTRMLRAVRVAGPIEPRDAQALLNASAQERSPLEVELRATAAVTVRDDRVLVLEVRERFDALAVVAESLRRYVAAVLRKPASEIGAPPLWQIERLLSVSGRLGVRPIETEAYTTSVDVGISTRSRDEIGPADRSLVYDIFSGTWHDEE